MSHRISYLFLPLILILLIILHLHRFPHHHQETLAREVRSGETRNAITSRSTMALSGSSILVYFRRLSLQKPKSNRSSVIAGLE
jgi:hypothetical protein